MMSKIIKHAKEPKMESAVMNLGHKAEMPERYHTAVMNLGHKAEMPER